MSKKNLTAWGKGDKKNEKGRRNNRRNSNSGD